MTVFDFIIFFLILAVGMGVSFMIGFYLAMGESLETIYTLQKEIEEAHKNDLGMR